jgi:protein FAM50
MGDFASNFSRPASDIYTVEGNVAGSRAAQLERDREAAQEAFERQKRKLHEESSSGFGNWTSKFAKSSTTESITTAKTTRAAKLEGTVLSSEVGIVGLVSAEEYRKFQEHPCQSSRNNESDEKDNKDDVAVADAAKEKEIKARKKAKKKEKKQQLAKLSFWTEEEEEEEILPAEEFQHQQQSSARRNGSVSTDTNNNRNDSLSLGKDPTVDTSFLPDAQREMQLQHTIQTLQREYQQKQAQMKLSKLEITYSYWDGSGHRRSVFVQQKDTIETFLEQVRQALRSEFRELSGITSDDLLYIKEDLIIPHDITFYDLIATKARGKSGPLFHFDVHDDVRMTIDVTVEKDESHPGKVVLLSWCKLLLFIFDDFDDGFIRHCANSLWISLIL